jgi:hypothetical protein
VTNEEVSNILMYLINFSSRSICQLAASLPSKTLPTARARRGSKRRSERQTRHTASRISATTYPADGATSHTHPAEKRPGEDKICMYGHLYHCPEPVYRVRP